MVLFVTAYILGIIQTGKTVLDFCSMDYFIVLVKCLNALGFILRSYFEQLSTVMHLG